jgi:hypothetical protein
MCNHPSAKTWIGDNIVASPNRPSKAIPAVAEESSEV